MNSNFLKDYLPIITAFVGAFMAYIFSNRHYRSERFYKDAAESLHDFYSPIFHEMRYIKINMNKYNREQLISEFLKKYLSNKTQLFKAHNAKLTQLFYDMDELFNEYKNNKEKETLEKVFDMFNNALYLIKNEYDDIQRSLYKQFPWYKQLNKRGPILRFLMDLTTLFYDIAQFLFIIWLLIIYILVFNRITGKNDVPEWLINNFSNITIICSSLYCFALVFRIPYFSVMIDYKKDSRIAKKVNKVIHEMLIRLLKKR